MMTRLDEQMRAAEKDPNLQALGGVLRMIGAQNDEAAALLEQDLATEGLKLTDCFAALFTHARAHQKSGCWASAVCGLDPENAVIRFVLDFYKIPPEWIGGGQAAQTATAAPAAPSGGLFDLL